MSHLPLNARAILEYLNELGYRNISAAQLKEFLKDLRKLIKYEERFGINIIDPDYFDLLHRHTTASFRAKVNDKENASRLLPTILKESKSPTSPLTDSANKMAKKGKKGKKGKKAKPEPVEAGPPPCLPLDKQPPKAGIPKGLDPKRMPRTVPLMSVSSQNEIVGPVLYMPSDCSINIPDSSISELKNRFEETMKYPFATCERTRFSKNSYMLRNENCGSVVHNRCDQCELPPNLGTGYMRCVAQCTQAPAAGKKGKKKKKKKKKKYQPEGNHRSSTPRRMEGGYETSTSSELTETDESEEGDDGNEEAALINSFEMKKQHVEKILRTFDSSDLLKVLEEVAARKSTSESLEKLNREAGVQSKIQTENIPNTPYVKLDGVSSKEAILKMQKLFKSVDKDISTKPTSLSGQPIDKLKNQMKLSNEASSSNQSGKSDSSDKQHKRLTAKVTLANGRMAITGTQIEACESPGVRKTQEIEKRLVRNISKIEEDQLRKNQDFAKEGKKTSTSKSVLISRPLSKSQTRKNSNQDPVALYQYYREQWGKFKNQIPGSETRQDIRWNVRSKLRNPLN